MNFHQHVISFVIVKECEPSVLTRTESMADWYKMASTIYLQVIITMFGTAPTMQKVIEHNIEII